MPRTVVIVCKLTNGIPDIKADYIGADKGALICAMHHIQMKLAIGDFDSVTGEGMRQIEKYSDEILRLSTVKDQSDSEAALQEAIARGYDNIYITGAFGGRMDHALVNLRLAVRCPHPVILMDDHNRVQVYRKGTYEITKQDYPYLSLFCDEPAILSISGVKYPLDHRLITFQDLFALSNEIKKETAILTVHQGTVIVIQSKD